MAIALYARELLRDVALPLADAIREDAESAELASVGERVRGLVGGELAEGLDRVFDEALAAEIHRALNTDALEREFQYLAARFWARISLPILELSDKLFSVPAQRDLARSVEVELGRALARVIYGSRYREAEGLVYALSVLVDRDVWVLDQVAKHGFEGFVKRVEERGGVEPLLNLAGYTLSLTFAWVSATAAVLGVAKEFRESNRDNLAKWCREYAREVEGYLDTLDLLLDDEAYGDLAALGFVKR